MKFKDHFSGHADAYEKFRPAYPEGLFRYLAKLPPSNALCWDCGTGNGQAARDLAPWFQRVEATDASAAQIERASGPENIRFRVAPAESSALESASVDLVTVAQALHWFSFAAFFEEVQRVLRPGGVLAVWGYRLSKVDAEIDQRVLRYYQTEIGPFWAAERQFVDEGYASVHFPGQEVTPPQFLLQANWTLDQFVGYLETWSATQKSIREGHREHFEGLREDLFRVWGKDESKIVSWPLFLRVFIMAE